MDKQPVCSTSATLALVDDNRETLTGVTREADNCMKFDEDSDYEETVTGEQGEETTKKKEENVAEKDGQASFPSGSRDCGICKCTHFISGGLLFNVFLLWLFCWS